MSISGFSYGAPSYYSPPSSSNYGDWDDTNDNSDDDYDYDYESSSQR